ncbi:MAG: N-carbamoylputrescine amidase [Myxococcales bacterium]|nr:N-carbamoylputrescine amidase [Myxococcales bacterium]
MSELRVGILQAAFGEDREANLATVERLVREAAAGGAQVVLPPELFERPYFPRTEEERFFEWAAPAQGHPTIERFQALAQELRIALPISFFERAGQAYYNSIAVIDADGEVLGVYRKSHIPDGPGYEEKFYFRPGDTGFRVFQSRYGGLGVGICWDQWFPECARALTLLGADILLYPTAIGAEPAEPEQDTRLPWQRVMVGHAVANHIPLAASNRIGIEGGQRFYGSSFIANPRGDLLAELDQEHPGVAVETFDLAAIRLRRASWGFFRDRRPELYRGLLEADGVR